MKCAWDPHTAQVAEKYKNNFRILSKMKFGYYHVIHFTQLLWKSPTSSSIFSSLKENNLHIWCVKNENGILSLFCWKIFVSVFLQFPETVSPLCFPSYSAHFSKCWECLTNWEVWCQFWTICSNLTNSWHVCVQLSL